MRLFFYHEFLNACSYYRCLLPNKYLNRIPGITSKASDSLTKAQIEESDVLVFQKKYKDQDFNLLQYAKGLGKSVVYEIDDNVFDVPIWNPSWNAINNVKARFRAFIEKCDLVTVTCEHLRKELLRFNRNIIVLPNCLDFEEIPPQKSIIPQVLNRRLEPLIWKDIKKSLEGKIVLGWSGSPTHREDLKIITKALLSLMQQNKNIIVMMVLGADKMLAQRAPESQIYFVRAVKLEEYYTLLRELDWDIGLAPLADVNFNKSKSNLKVIEYAALGIIPVATNFENYTKTFEPNFNNLLVKSNHGWEAALKQLINSNLENLRSKLLQFVKKEYNIENQIYRWEHYYKKIRKH